MTPSERALLLAVAKAIRTTVHGSERLPLRDAITAVEAEAEKPSDKFLSKEEVADLLASAGEPVKTCPACEDRGWEIRGGCPSCGTRRKE